jgi:hypothetical protein
MFAQGRPFGWQMTIQGSRERLLDSVLPHEITHTIFATHFGRPLPRWADEGACTTVEHISEKTKQQRLLINFLTTGRGIAFNRMFAMKEYPPDILPLYSQGYSLARYLIAQGGKRKFIEYVGDGMDWNNWTAATKKHYGIESLSDLQVAWLDWVRRGSPPLASQGTQIAQADPRQVGQPAADSTQPAAPAAPSAVPEVNTVASVAQPFDSWYARQRDAARQETGSPVAAAAPRPEADATGTEQPQTEPAVYSSATRPQPIGTPEPTVIQWTAEPTPSYGAPASVAPPPLVAIPLQSTLPQRY